MGSTDDWKAAAAADTARRAAAEGRTVLLYGLSVDSIAGKRSDSISHGAEVIEAIEHTGWRLDHMAYSEWDSSYGSMVLMFRRAS